MGSLLLSQEPQLRVTTSHSQPGGCGPFKRGAIRREKEQRGEQGLPTLALQSHLKFPPWALPQPHPPRWVTSWPMRRS